MKKVDSLKLQIQIIKQGRKKIRDLLRTWNYLEKMIRDMPETELRKKLLSYVKSAKSWGGIRSLYCVRDSIINITNTTIRENISSKERKAILGQLEVIKKVFDLAVDDSEEESSNGF